MPKQTTVFVCSDCGNDSPKWFGKCPACNSWNTCYEEKVSKGTKTGSNIGAGSGRAVTPTKLNDVKQSDTKRNSTRI